jgi:hypothetical protein
LRSNSLTPNQIHRVEQMSRARSARTAPELAARLHEVSTEGLPSIVPLSSEDMSETKRTPTPRDLRRA